MVLLIPTLEFKTQLIKEQWESGKLSPKIVFIISLLLKYSAIEFPDYKIYTISDLLRTQEGQNSIYLNHINPITRNKYQKKPWKSVHQFWRGADVRTYDMPENMAVRLTKFINLITYDPRRPRKKTAIYHDAGTGAHIHIQSLV